MEEKDWLSKEKLVELIEKSISPNSIIEHNVKLPDLSSKNNKKRQCDIVIKSGPKERETVTIVEVQSRISKFNLTFFQGLIQKMRDVGAQHLICVSTSGFTNTIIDKAKELGGTVRLVMLNKFNPDEIPVDLPKLSIQRIISSYIQTSEPEIDFTTDYEIGFYLKDMKFKINEENEELDINELNNFYITNVLKPSNNGFYKIKLPIEGIKLFLCHSEEKFIVNNYSLNVKIELEKHEIPVYAYSYEQIDSGSLAWVLESISTIENKTRIVRMALTKNENGEFNSKFIISK